MKGNKLISCLCLWGSFVISLPAPAQELIPLTRAALDSLMNPPLMKEGEKILKFSQTQQTIGTIHELDTPRTVHFSFRNLSANDVTITRVRTFCGCTVSTFSKRPLKPGEKGSVSLTYHPKNHPGSINECAYIYTTVSPHPVARLAILGEVLQADPWQHLPANMDCLRLKRKSIIFTQVSKGMEEVNRIVCANTGSKPLQLSASTLPEHVFFRMEPAILAPGQEGDMVIGINGRKFQPSKGFEFLIEGIETTESNRTIKVIIE